MELLRNLLVVAHLVGMAAIVGGYLVSLRRPVIASATVWGARAQLITGVALVGLLESGAIDDAEPDHVKIAVKLLVAVVVTGVAESQRRKSPVPPWAFHVVGLGALLNVLVAVLW